MRDRRPTIWTLVAARALQGVAAALLTPGSLAILQASFRPQDRMRAIGAWSGLTGVATAAGPIVGGWLVAWTWRSIFWLNLPLAVGACWCCAAASFPSPATRAPRTTWTRTGVVLAARRAGRRDVLPDRWGGAGPTR